ncbi:hypothetical protein MKL09_25245 [Methylobacterium sp. J-048]|uniref:hypothetical protein n=1 Tax=Methylobacterium sp. J-048 TaxID=2836635 RepID=UPI001FBB4CCB|nr:hypothetical protein [Methylobacterium sp. J-048]MCJ2059823.1 hypothetical protein [Methylobacterium sp. J-048]
MGLTHMETETGAPIGALVGGALALDPRVVAVALLSGVMLTAQAPAFAGYDAHRFEDTALRAPRAPVAYAEPEEIKRLQTIAAYEAGWDGPESVGPTIETSRQALAFVRELHALGDLARPYISLAGDGEINFYWKTPHVELDLGFTGTRQYSYYGRTPDGIEFAEDGAAIGTPLPPELIAVLRT